MEYRFQQEDGSWVSGGQIGRNSEGVLVDKQTGHAVTEVSVPAEAVVRRGETFVLTEQPAIRVDSRAYKMEPRGNVVNPDQIVHDCGADTLRLYEMFMGPFGSFTKPWSMDGVRGVAKFLDRAWRMMIDDRETLVFSAAVQDVAATQQQNRVLSPYDHGRDTRH